jgi:hypothetical protein
LGTHGNLSRRKKRAAFCLPYPRRLKSKAVQHVAWLGQVHESTSNTCTIVPQPGPQNGASTEVHWCICVARAAPNSAGIAYLCASAFAQALLGSVMLKNACTLHVRTGHAEECSVELSLQRHPTLPCAWCDTKEDVKQDGEKQTNRTTPPSKTPRNMFETPPRGNRPGQHIGNTGKWRGTNKGCASNWLLSSALAPATGIPPDKPESGLLKAGCKASSTCCRDGSRCPPAAIPGSMCQGLYTMRDRDGVEGDEARQQTLRP